MTLHDARHAPVRDGLTAPTGSLVPTICITRAGARAAAAGPGVKVAPIEGRCERIRVSSLPGNASSPTALWAPRARLFIG